MDNIKLIQEIRKKYDSMSKSNQAVADFLLENAHDFINMTAQEIGEISNTSSATVIRFAKSLDFDGLENLKSKL